MTGKMINGNMMLTELENNDPNDRHPKPTKDVGRNSSLDA